MDAWKVVEQMVRLVKEGRVPDSALNELLTASGVELTCNAKVGKYQGGMLRDRSGAVHTLDPGGILGFRFPKPEPPAAPPKVIKLEAETDIGFSDEF
jgi:hypothetical protein